MLCNNLEAKESLIKGELMTPSNSELLSPIWQKRVALTDNYWCISLHWVIKKKYNNSHKIPFKRRYAKVFEPFGDWLLSILNMIEALHAMPSPLKNGYDIDKYLSKYPDSWTHFTTLINCIKLDDYRAVLKLKPTENKSTIKKIVREEIRSLRDFQNPVIREDDYLFWELVECGRLVARDEFNKAFRQNIWLGRRFKKKSCLNHLGFIHAYSQWLHCLLSPDCNQISVRGDQIVELRQNDSARPLF